MPTFDVAHIREQGVDLIIVPLDAAFRFKTEHEQDEARETLQIGAGAAGLAGTVVPVWDNGCGRMAFLAPRTYHPFFQNISLDFVYANLNRRLILN